ncbi:MAG TPA: hypothetical protein VHT03_04975 [Rhizomicrobium sp.]|jgi:hypothetical protein|nr:hypothetical protein [Rhizomicrobium sp.]
MPPDQALAPLNLILADPILLAGMLLPFVMVAGLLIYRIRLSRRFATLAKRNAEVLDQTAGRWQEAAARTEKMITLLTEIRDHMAKIAPASPARDS